jgi:hypothetical protein
MSSLPRAKPSRLLAALVEALQRPDSAALAAALYAALLKAVTGIARLAAVEAPDRARFIGVVGRVDEQALYDSWERAFADPGPSAADEARWRHAHAVSRDRCRELRRSCPSARLHKIGPKFRS